MKYMMAIDRRRGFIVVLALFLCGGVLAGDAVGQAKKARQVPAAKVVKPVVPVSNGSGTAGSAGTGLGGASGAGLGAATGSGVGTASGSGTGAPSGAIIVRPSGNSAGQSSGTGTGSATGNATGTGTGNGTGTNAGPASTPAEAKVVVAPTYIKELNGRCYYVTPAGGKQFVARRNCALYP